MLLISARQSGHFLIFVELYVLAFRKLNRQEPQNIWVHSNIIGCVTLSKHIEHILVLISVIRSVKSLIFPSMITISLVIAFTRFAFVSSIYISYLIALKLQIDKKIIPWLMLLLISKAFAFPLLSKVADRLDCMPLIVTVEL